MMMIIITRYPASEDRLIVRPLLIYRRASAAVSAAKGEAGQGRQSPADASAPQRAGCLHAENEG